MERGVVCLGGCTPRLMRGGDCAIPGREGGRVGREGWGSVLRSRAPTRLHGWEGGIAVGSIGREEGEVWWDV